MTPKVPRASLHTRRFLIRNAVPSENLPKGSHDWVVRLPKPPRGLCRGRLHLRSLALGAWRHHGPQPRGPPYPHAGGTCLVSVWFCIQHE
ncbi:uncharacterized protein LOC120844090 isoform X2 [Ixodes scapularis]|uniref:uncharacterized protein LOC120844090 isoform X2 n=1 Tax=Ixodes scapularis TaxID=6945 RepID=UPI001A9E25B7|nr:uncharacterized protein LOC120844090 isoform X2 [Ixodes scapularis]